MRHGILILTLTCFSLLLAAGTAEATVIFDNGSEQLFDSDVGFFDSPTTDISFAESFTYASGESSAYFTSGTAEETLFTAVNSSYLAIEFTDNEVLAPYALVTTGTVEITFDPLDGPMNRIGFNYFATTEIFVEAFSYGTMVFASPAPGFVSFPETSFLGLQSKQDITSVRVHDDGGTFYLRDIQGEAGILIPEPTSLAVWSLLGLSLAGFGWRRRK